MPYEMLDHTADVKFKASASTLEDVFVESTKAFSEIVTYEDQPIVDDSDSKTHSFEIESENLDALLYDFLDRLIYIQDVNGVFIGGAKEIDIEEIEEGYSLEATVKTYPIGDAALLDIKGATYNDMTVEEKEDEWIVKAVLDI